MALEKVVNIAAKAAMKTKVAEGVVKGAAKAGTQAAKEGIEATSKAYTGAMINASRKAANQTGEGIINEAVKNAGKESLEKYTAKALSGQDLTKMTKKQLGGYAADLGLDINSKTTKAQMVDMMNDRLKNIGNVAANDVVENGTKNAVRASSGIGKNAFIGGAVGSITGAGVGGLTGMATGADEDNMKSMVVMGALAGGAGGAMIGAGSKMFRNKKISGSMFAQSSEALEAAKQMAKEGGTNSAVLDGAKGIFGKAGASAQNFADKIDDIGYTVQHKYTGAKGKEASKIISEMQEAGDFNIIDKDSFVEGLTGGIKRKGATLGGAAQGAIMGSAGGALIGGVSGGIDEDETFIGGALKGGFIGGTLGGIGGGISGYANNSAKLLSNTTANVKSLIGK